MPGGWLMWMLEQYGINHEVVKSQDFAGDLNAKYDVMLLPSGTSRAADRQRARSEAQRSGRVVVGLRRRRRRLEEAARRSSRTAARCWRSASAVETARELLDLPIEKALPEAPPRFGRGARARRRRRTPAGVGRSRAARRVLQPGAADADAARSRRRSGESCSIARARCSRTSSTRIIRWPGACRRRGRSSSRAIRRIGCVPASASRPRSRPAIRGRTSCRAAGCSARNT